MTPSTVTALLTRERLAAALDLVHSRYGVSDWAWEPAGVIMTGSDGTRAGVAELRAQAQRQNRARGEAHGERETAAAAVIDEHAARAALRQAVARMTRHHREHAEPSCPRTCITMAIASKYRRLVVDDVIERALAPDLLEAVEGRYLPGKLV
jgi:hypothetical protein